MDLDQYTALQPRIVALQRLALELLELGHAREAVKLSQVALLLLRIKPTKSAPAESKAQKSRGAA